MVKMRRLEEKRNLKIANNKLIITDKVVPGVGY
jgi:hypothetical protein